jgi:MFS family permease
MRAARGGGRLRAAALALVVGVVLADSSVVILALPDVLAEFDAEIAPVTWVITAFNLVLAAAAVPAAYLSRRVAPAHACVAGLAVFAAACVGCAAAGSLDMLIAARCVQALGGALAVCAALELLPADTGGERRAAAVWTAAGAVGAAVGPAAGGILTEAISWQAIFLAQVPLALAPAAALLRAPAPTERAAGPAGRPHLAANAALALVSAALAAALFLLVLLLVEGWGRSPIAAAAVVSVMPLAALAVYRAVGDIGSPAQRAAAGAIAIAGGLAALGLLPGGSWAWTLLPQMLVGAGLALAVAALTDAALHGRAPQAIHGG